MRLKKLELYGFKSFADRTEILFDAGVTCVVGPNGCGKSNISDAIRWVLGERSAKLLRGSKMEDVIFNGTDFRKSVAFAEVSLTIDNTNRGLPIDYQEVTLTRRLYRSGESEYLINRTLCRLKDIQDLILDTGIGSSSYSMIEQGRIDYVLNADADERRFLIEEAAGISKYKVKKEEAIRKLQRTEENLLRLNDIVQEVHKNIQYAERQAKRAEKYKQQFEQLKKLEIKKMFLDLNLIREEKTGLESEQSSAQSQIEARDAEKKQCLEKIRGFETLLHGMVERYSSDESRRYALKARRDQNQQQLGFHQEKRVELATRRGENQQEESQLIENVQKTQAEMESKKSTLQSLEAEKHQVSEQLKISEQALHQMEAHLESCKVLMDKSRSEIFEISSEMTKIKNEYHRTLALIETRGEQKHKIRGSLERFQYESSQWEARKNSSDRELTQLQDKLQMLESEKTGLCDRLKALSESLRRMEEDRRRDERTLHERKTRLEILKELDVRSGADKKWILDGARGLDAELIQQIRDVVSVEPGYEWALEAALGSFAQALIAPDLEIIRNLLEHLDGKKTIAVGILLNQEALEEPQFQLSEVDAPGYVECALRDVVKVVAPYQNSLKPLLDGVYVLRSFEPAQLDNILSKAASCRLVTKEGVCFGPGRRVFFRHGPSLQQNFFERGNEIKNLESSVGQLEESEKNASASLAQTRLELAEVENSIKAVDAQFMDFKIQKEACESLRSSIQDRTVTYTRELEILNLEFDEIENDRSEMRSREDALKQELARIEEIEKQAYHNQESLRRQIDELEQEKSRKLKEVAELSARFQHAYEKDRLQQEALAILFDGQARGLERIEYLRQEAERIVEKEKSLEALDIQLKEELLGLDEEMRVKDVSLEILRKEKEETEKEMAAFQQALEELSRKQMKVQETLHQIEMKLMDLSYQEKSVIDRVEQAYHVKVCELNAEEFLPADDGAQQEGLLPSIEALRQRVESIGTVNLLAIDEYDELKKRYDFLIAQQKDMEQARESLLEAIRKINRTTKGLFEETFANVQKAFQEYYQVLFRGGEARLVLIDETHPLESGIDIVVRPPGKKLQHITLLSGGEKALTAIALLFALFRIKPSPFCVLDEVDAPLDEANIDRFLTVLRTFLESSQFIIVTHNRKTIAMGDSLYGVTMEEAGVSKIVSVKVRSDDDEPAEETTEREKTAAEDTVPA